MLQALADPVRLQLLRVLDDADGELACNEIALPVTKSTASHHFKVLREAGVIEGPRRRDPPVLHVPRTDDLEARFPGLLDTVLRASTTPDGRTDRVRVRNPRPAGARAAGRA